MAVASRQHEPIGRRANQYCVQLKSRKIYLTLTPHPNICKRKNGGPLGCLLKNRIYLGEIHHSGQWYPGEHQAILDIALFEAVQARTAENLHVHRAIRSASNALLLGRIVDDRGNTMTPTYSYKGKLRRRYYVSRAIIEKQQDKVGAVRRVPAPEVEAKVIETLRSVTPDPGPDTDDRTTLKMIQRVRIESDQIVLELAEETAIALGKSQMQVPWSSKPKKVKRCILLPHADPAKDQRPIRAERRETLLRAVAAGRAWFKELSTDAGANIDAIAIREDRSKRSVQMLISLAFVAPDIIEAAAAGALPRGIGLTRLTDLPPLWTEQRRVLGLQA